MTHGHATTHTVICTCTQNLHPCGIPTMALYYTHARPIGCNTRSTGCNHKVRSTAFPAQHMFKTLACGSDLKSDLSTAMLFNFFSHTTLMQCPKNRSKRRPARTWTKEACKAWNGVKAVQPEAIFQAMKTLHANSAPC